MNKNILVTGSAKGIGKELIIRFAKEGYNVVINYLTNEIKVKELKEHLEKTYKVKVLAIKADISNENEVKNMINVIKEELGNIDILINNAAYCRDNTYLDKTKEEFLRVLEVNVVGTFLVTKYALDVMNNGTVINISSLDSCKTYNALSMDYCASKAGVNSLVQTFSLVRSDIKFVSIMLPWVNTESVKEMYKPYLESELKRVNQKRLLEPKEVADEIYNILNANIKSGSIIEMEVK